MASTGSAPDVQLLALFGVGSVLLRGAGCTINDFWVRLPPPRPRRTRAAGSRSPAARGGGAAPRPSHNPRPPILPPLAPVSSRPQDRDVDRLVERTRSRPIASGQVSPAAALAFLGAQLLAGLGVLVQLNDFSVLVGAASLGLARAPLLPPFTPSPRGAAAAR